MMPVKTVGEIPCSLYVTGTKAFAGTESHDLSAKVGLINVEFLAHLTSVKEGLSEERVLPLFTIQICNREIVVIVPGKDESIEEKRRLFEICVLIKGIAQTCCLREINQSKLSEKDQEALFSFAVGAKALLDNMKLNPFLLERAMLLKNLQ